jgi:cell wall-associated NlpC family hydrolase
VIQADAIVAEARRWLGVPFVHQGRTRFGVDCIGLVICVRHELEQWPAGMNEHRAYRRRERPGALMPRVRAHLLETDTPGPGVVVMIQWPKNPEPSHAAILTGAGTIIHAYERAGRVLEVGFRSQWLRWARGFYRLPGVRYE